MKTKRQPLNKVTRKTKSKRATNSRTVSLANVNHPILRHFRLVEHKHTGKLVHFKHTSHLALVGILVIVGFFLFASSSLVSSLTSGQVTVGVIVPGKAPTVGAVITSPLDGTIYKDYNVVKISGTCSPESFVVVKDNNITAGSTNCTIAGIFVMDIQLSNGNNVLGALNYDNLNQVGPSTPLVTVRLEKPVTVAPVEVIMPTLPSNPSTIPGLQPAQSDCDDYNPGNLVTGGEPHVAVVCVPRLFMPKIDQVMGILVWGGAPPYALRIDFSDGKGDTLVSISKPGYITRPFHYEFPGTYKIDFKLTDNKGSSAVVQTAVQASGVPVSGSAGSDESGTGATLPDDVLNSNPAAKMIKEVLQSSWFDSPVPFYLLAVSVTLGFWGGDIFTRKFGAGRMSPKKRKAA